MREILFRVWNGKEYTYDIEINNERQRIYIGETEYTLYDDVEITSRKYRDMSELEQYIGIKDKNDIKMFSGDKFRVHSKNNENWHIDKIVRINPNSLTLEVANLDELKNEDMGQIWQRPQEYWWKDRIGRIEIIGNIHDK